MILQDQCGPLSEFDAPFGIHFVTHGNNHVKIVII